MFNLVSKYKPAGDQTKAINELVSSIKKANKYQTLIGVTGSGKTFTMANIIKQIKKPTLIMTHNKTLAAQLYSEFKTFFPKNRVEYFVSYYDYYQPEAYIPRQDLFIEKDSSINEDIERLRLSATSSILSYDDVIVIASVSANYGLGDPKEYEQSVLTLKIGEKIEQKKLLYKLSAMGYTRNDAYFDRANFRVNGDIVDIFLAYFDDEAIRIEFFGDEIEKIYVFEVLNNKKTKELDLIRIYATSNFIVGETRLKQAIKNIEEELALRLKNLKENDKLLEHQRLKQRTEFDLEMLEATGMCKGIENYSRHLTDKKEGETPYTLLDYFEYKDKDYLLIVDESHVSLPQFRGMYAGDRSRKEVLVDYGFRLPSALDNRPLKFDEFINKSPSFLFVSATPSKEELGMSTNISEQIIRPTGLLDPKIEVKSSKNQVEDLFDEIKKSVAKEHRVLVTTLTKKMSEDLRKYLADLGIKVEYMHSDVDTIQRSALIRGLRLKEFDVLVGINLLREGLDLPEVALVAILDADKEGFLRSEVSLVQTIGRAARNVEGRVIMYAEKITKSMQKAIETTKNRRKIQEDFNKKHNIKPKTTKRALDDKLKMQDYSIVYKNNKEKLPKTESKKLIQELNIKMKEAAKKLEFEEAARLRDEIAKIKKI